MVSLLQVTSTYWWHGSKQDKPSTSGQSIYGVTNYRLRPHIDGMDQNKTNLQHIVRLNKSACNMWVLRTHLTGALIHERRSYTFVDLHLWPHDVNLTCTVLLMILQKEANQAYFHLPCTCSLTTAIGKTKTSCSLPSCLVLKMSLWRFTIILSYSNFYFIYVVTWCSLVIIMLCTLKINDSHFWCYQWHYWRRFNQLAYMIQNV